MGRSCYFGLSKRITRGKVKVDRVAGPWLIKKFRCLNSRGRSWQDGWRRFLSQQGQKEVAQANPGLKSRSRQPGVLPNKLTSCRDLLTGTKIDTLVILTFESASPTKPVAQPKNKEVYVTVVDRAGSLSLDSFREELNSRKQSRGSRRNRNHPIKQSTLRT
jgi:hypothetical protein